MVAVPTTSGTGSEVTPFAVVTDEKTRVKYPIADYELTPQMAIVDANLVMDMPKGLTSAGGIDAVVHSLEAYVSVMANEYSDGQALQALKLLKAYLPSAYKNGAADPKAREQVHNAATIAGIAFANAFLGVCHSMAHKIGAQFNIPHGTANAMLIANVVRYNAADIPTKQAAFSQYDRPKGVARYAEIARHLGLGGSRDHQRVELLVDWIEALKGALDVPPSIKEWGVREADFLAEVDALAEAAFDDQCTGANPRYPLVSELKQSCSTATMAAHTSSLRYARRRQRPRRSPTWLRPSRRPRRGPRPKPPDRPGRGRSAANEKPRRDSGPCAAGFLFFTAKPLARADGRLAATSVVGMPRGPGTLAWTGRNRGRAPFLLPIRHLSKFRGIAPRVRMFRREGSFGRTSRRNDTCHAMGAMPPDAGV